jgi:hypothetical protein
MCLYQLHGEQTAAAALGLQIPNTKHWKAFQSVIVETKQARTSLSAKRISLWVSRIRFISFLRSAISGNIPRIEGNGFEVPV